MSQQWIPISKKASTAPVATRHMLVAAVPDPRSLSGRIKHTWVEKKEEKTNDSPQQQRSSLFLDLPVYRDAKDPLLGGEDLGHHVFVPVGAVLGDDDGLVDVCEGRSTTAVRKIKENNPTRLQGLLTLTVTS